MIRQGEIWWADLPVPEGSEPGYRRPVIVVQCDAFNRSRIRTVVCVSVGSNLRLADAPGNVALSTEDSGLPRESVANVSQVVTVDRRRLASRAGALPRSVVDEVMQGIDVVMGRSRS